MATTTVLVLVVLVVVLVVDVSVSTLVDVKDIVSVLVFDCVEVRAIVSTT